MTDVAPGPALRPLKNAKHESVLQAWIADPARVWWKAYSSVYPKCSQHAAETAASRLMNNAEFCARRDALLSQVTERVVSAAVMSETEVLEELTKLARSSIKNCIVDGDVTGDVVASLRELDDQHAAAIQELTVETYMEGAGDDAREVKRVKVKLHSKTAALHEMRAHYEPQKHEHTGKGGKPIEIKDLSVAEAGRRIAFALARAQRGKQTTGAG